MNRILLFLLSLALPLAAQQAVMFTGQPGAVPVSLTAGSGTVTDVELLGTANQITLTGTCDATTTISCTFSIPSAFVLPGTINGLTLTTSTGTITLTNGKTFTVAKTLTLDGTDGVTITFPASNATVATLGLTNTFTGRQDASGAASTAPAKVGTSTPGTCTVGDQFFDSDATAGQNLYGCTATNTWTLQGDGAGSGTSPVCTVTRTSSTVLTWGATAAASTPCIINIGNKPYIFTSPVTFTVSSSGSITTYIYLDSSGNLTLAKPSGTITTSGGVVVTASAFPVDAYQIWTWTASSSTWDVSGGTQYAGIGASKKFVAGSGVTLTDTADSLTIAASASSTGGVQRVAYASLPTCDASVDNTQFVFTDGVGVEANCNGSSYSYFYNGMPVALVPAATNWTIVGTGTSKTDYPGVVSFDGVGSGAQAWYSMIKAVPGSTPYTITVGFKYANYNQSTSQSCGMAITDGTTTGSKIDVLQLYRDNDNATSLRSIYYSDYATYGGAVLGGARFGLADDVVWFRYADNGTNRTWSYSVAGPQGKWTTLFSETRTTNLTATHIGVACQNTDSTATFSMPVLHWDVQ